MVPHLTTALSGPLLELEKRFLDHATESSSGCACSGAGTPSNRFYAYGVVARLALLAASVEIEETEPAFAEPVA